MPWWGQLSSTCIKPVNNPTQTQVGDYQVNQGRDSSTGHWWRRWLWPLAAPLVLTLITGFPIPALWPRGKKKKPPKIKKFCTLDCSRRKREEMALKLQRKERSADREEHFFFSLPKKPHKAGNTQFKRVLTAWAPQASLHPTGKGHSFNWSL